MEEVRPAKFEPKPCVRDREAQAIASLEALAPFDLDHEFFFWSRDAPFAGDTVVRRVADYCTTLRLSLGLGPGGQGRGRDGSVGPAVVELTSMPASSPLSAWLHLDTPWTLLGTVTSENVTSDSSLTIHLPERGGRGGGGGGGSRLVRLVRFRVTENWQKPIVISPFTCE